ncbi:formimidoylglutamate deiminase [Novilysobacter spongiicola]|uniref:Formimidoylglutamate deiminase n=1 Tax=Lysobacter spongiicola DSM 21749 TaxID=1122188 RepID=A0A1T4S5U1_9GAMM|nr:formimidoylglutamate deiminase [Lysobacter spongiicola]SKA23614.1 formimidoylglutamate deiminase [Lysobacter spongiicola DSM 21749]
MRTIPNARTWHPDGWQDGVKLDVDAHGHITAGRHGGTTDQRVLPGIANLHSHAFQRAMAGMGERQTNPADSFWTWRETMYRFAARFTPETLHAVAAQLYAEMLEAGYTTVCEFHYLHHAPDGKPYEDPAAMSRALVAAARETGIRLTLLPVLYMTGGFDGRALGERQKRFGHDVEGYLRLLDALRNEEGPLVRVDCALHSLRAVPEAAMTEVLAALPSDSRIHVHIAEQTAEVDECVERRGARPVQWLLDQADVGPLWTLVHATHLDDAEVRRVAASGATVAICPTTEANLGDGLFRLRDFLDAGGRWGIGSDSHISVSPVEELRWLEYGQRLVTRRRNIAATERFPSVGESLLHHVASSAGDSTGHPIGGLYEGEYADALVLDVAAAQLAGAQDEDAIDRWVFSGNRPLVREAWVGGKCVVDNGRHYRSDLVAHNYRAAMERLLAD